MLKNILVVMLLRMSFILALNCPIWNCSDSYSQSSCGSFSSAQNKVNTTSESLACKQGYCTVWQMTEDVNSIIFGQNKDNNLGQCQLTNLEYNSEFQQIGQKYFWKKDCDVGSFLKDFGLTVDNCEIDETFSIDTAQFKNGLYGWSRCNSDSECISKSCICYPSSKQNGRCDTSDFDRYLILLSSFYAFCNGKFELACSVMELGVVWAAMLEQDFPECMYQQKFEDVNYVNSNLQLEEAYQIFQATSKWNSQPKENYDDVVQEYYDSAKMMTAVAFSFLFLL